MGKKRIELYLDEESATVVREYLQANGQSISGWVNAFVTEFAQGIKGQPSPLSKPVEEMTLKEFGDVMAYWFKRSREVKIEDHEVKPSGP